MKKKRKKNIKGVEEILSLLVGDVTPRSHFSGRQDISDLMCAGQECYGRKG